MIQLFSPNMLKTYETCPKKFYFRYVKKISMPVDDEMFETGKNVHALASYYLKKENIDRLELALNDREKEFWNYLKGVEYFSYEIVNTEYNLSVKVGDYFFGGRLDALVKKDNRYYILDYKTGSAPKNAEYDFQTMIYLLAVKEFFNTNSVCFVYIDLKNKTEVKIELTEKLVENYRQKLIEIVQKIQTNEFNKRSTACNCEFEIICY